MASLSFDSDHPAALRSSITWLLSSAVNQWASADMASTPGPRPRSAANRSRVAARDPSAAAIAARRRAARRAACPPRSAAGASPRSRPGAEAVRAALSPGPGRAAKLVPGRPQELHGRPPPLPAAGGTRRGWPPQAPAPPVPARHPFLPSHPTGRASGLGEGEAGRQDPGLLSGCRVLAEGVAVPGSLSGRGGALSALVGGCRGQGQRRTAAGAGHHTCARAARAVNQ